MRVRSYRHAFSVAADVADVTSFHMHPESMAAITPPGVRVRVRQAPDLVATGRTMDFTLQLGPLSVDWQAEFDSVSESGFVDRQVSGPFILWVHEHRFVSEVPGATIVEDHIEARFGQRPSQRLICHLMWFGLPVLFAFRSWKTRQILEDKTG